MRKIRILNKEHTHVQQGKYTCLRRCAQTKHTYWKRTERIYWKMKMSVKSRKIVKYDSGITQKPFEVFEAYLQDLQRKSKSEANTLNI